MSIGNIGRKKSTAPSEIGWFIKCTCAAARIVVPNLQVKLIVYHPYKNLDQNVSIGVLADTI